MNTVALALLLFAPLWFQDDLVFRSGVSLVRVDAEVTDPNGQIVTGLKKDDFSVRDNGDAQNIVNFSFEQEPLDLILLFDTSGSMHGKLRRVVAATELGFHELRKGDRVCVMAFNTDTAEVTPFTESLDTVNEAILIKVLGMKFGGTSKLEAAADKAALRFRREPTTQRRRAVLVVTDNPGSRMPGEQSVIRDLWASDAVFSELIIGRPATANAITEKTGGSVLATMPDDPGAAFQQSLHQIRSRYTLYYSFPAAVAGTERTVRVELAPGAAVRFPNARIYARTGYIVPGR